MQHKNILRVETSVGTIANLVRVVASYAKIDRELSYSH